MTALLICLCILRASAFSLDGLGEDQSVFSQAFIDIGNTAQLTLRLRPEISLLNQGTQIRSVFWTNPFNFALFVPVSSNFQIGFGNQERYNQDCDLYYGDEDLTVHLKGKGSVEEVDGTVQFSYRDFRSALRAGYLFGNAREIWSYYIGDYTLVDSFNYRYDGYIFSGGLQYRFISIFGDGLGRLDIVKPSSDTVFDLPMRVGIKISPWILKGKASVIIEKTMWDDPFRAPLRFQVGYGRASYHIDYSYNPWYLQNIDEHSIKANWRVPVSRMGVINLELGIAMRKKGEFREFCITPQMKLEVNEFFTRRKK